MSAPGLKEMKKKKVLKEGEHTVYVFSFMFFYINICLWDVVELKHKEAENWNCILNFVLQYSKYT